MAKTQSWPIVGARVSKVKFRLLTLQCLKAVQSLELFVDGKDDPPFVIYVCH